MLSGLRLDSRVIQQVVDFCCLEIHHMYPAGRRLSNSKVSFDTAVRSHLLASLFYGAGNRFLKKAGC